MKFLRYAVRFLAMGVVMWWYLMRYLFGRLRTLGVARGEPRRSAVAHLRGRTLRELCSSLGATFVKLGQVLSTRPDLLPQEMTEELRLLQDRLPPFSSEAARKIIAEDLGKPADQVFAEFDEQPVAAASVAQVHRARLADGTEVAVKVLRPDVRKKVMRDAVIVRFFARIMAWHPKLRLSDPVGHMEEFSRGIIEQTDLANEVKNYQRFAQNFADMQGVRFPRVYPELCGPRVMTMEFVHGTKVDALPAGDHRDLANRLQLTIFKMCFDHGFIHADLHPGNMVVCGPAKDLVIFDVGLVKSLGDDVFLQFIDFTRCIVSGGPHDFMVHLQRFHQYMGEIDWDGMEKDIVEFLTHFRAQNVGQLETGAMFNELYSIARRYHVRPMPDIVLVMVGIVTAEGIGKQLNPHSNLFEQLSAFLLPLMATRGLLPTAAPAASPAATGVAH